LNHSETPHLGNTKNLAARVTNDLTEHFAYIATAKATQFPCKTYTWTVVNEMPLHAPEDNDDIGDNALIVNGHAESILPLCATLAARINGFLETEAETPLLRAVQEQTRVALGVINTALERYRYFFATFPSQLGLNLLRTGC
jgi:hypothetical protein